MRVTNDTDIPQRIIDRLATRVLMGPGGCVVSTYPPGGHGYPQVRWFAPNPEHDPGDEDSPKSLKFDILAHRLAYRIAHGEIPEGMTIDHSCRNRRCVNPLHLRPLTNRVNGTLNGNVMKTHCPQGHPYDEANTDLRRHRNGRLHRFCRACAQGHNASRSDRAIAEPKPGTCAERVLTALRSAGHPVPVGVLFEHGSPPNVREQLRALERGGHVQRVDGQGRRGGSTWEALST